MKAFSEQMRYEYNLSPESVIIDAGAYDGNWMKEMWNLHHCNILAFEPEYDHWLKCVKLAGELEPERRKIAVLQLALSSTSGLSKIGVSGDSTGVYNPSEDKQVCELRDVAEVIGTKIAVMKLNIEGSEFDVIERLINSGLVREVENIQVQFHRVVPDFDYRYARLREALLTTHEPEWDSEIVWQNWRLK